MTIKTVRIVETPVTKTKRKKKETKETKETKEPPRIIHKIIGGDVTGTTLIRNVSTNAVINSINPATNAASPNPTTWLKYPENTPVSPQVNRMNYTPQQGGKQDKYDKQDTRQIKVELKKKTTAKKVHLNPKTTKPAPKVKKHTKKVRKISLGLSTFHKRITRAKKLHMKIKELKLDKLKEKLIKEGLIKSTSKAPESVLRQIANDSELVNKQAL